MGLSPFSPIGFPGAYSRTDVQPFTYRDSITYTELQERLKEYVVGLAPEINDSLSQMEALVFNYYQEFTAGQISTIAPLLLAGFNSGVFTVAPLPLGGGQSDVANLNAALASAGTVLIRPGTYVVDDNLYVYGTTRTHVTAYGAVFQYSIGAANVAPTIRMDHAAHIIEGLTINGNGAADSSSGIMNYHDGAIIRNNVITNMGRFGIMNSGGNRVTISGNYTDHTSQSTAQSDAPSVAAIISDNGSQVNIVGNFCTNTRWGITNRSDSSTQNVLGCLIEGNYISCDPVIATVDLTCQGLSQGWGDANRTIGNFITGYPNNAIDHHGSHHDVITGNTIFRCNSDGIFVGDYDGTVSAPTRVTVNTVISGNSISGIGTGIRVYDGAQFVTVSGNTIDNFSNHGIWVRGGTNLSNVAPNNVTVTGNMLNSENNAVGVGIWITGCIVALVGQNQVNRPGTYGLLVDGGSDMVRVENNVFQGSGYKLTSGQMDAIWTNCSRTFIRGNTFYGGNGVAINIAGGTNSTVTGNRFRSITSGPITDAGTTTTQSDNLTV